MAAYRAAVNHAARYRNPGRELVAFSLQRPVYLSDVREVVSPLGRTGPGLYKLEDLGSHFRVDGDGANGLQERDQVVHELARGNFG